MINEGQIIELGMELFAVIKIGRKTVSGFKCNLEHHEYILNSKEFCEFTLQELEESKVNMIGTLSEFELEKGKRLFIASEIEQFYNRFHKKPKDDDHIHYAGKVYDEKEMISLVDASLDFWLTSGRFAEKFEKELANFLGVKYAVLTNSGSSANLLAISALTSPKLETRRLLPGDEVITVAAGFPTTVAPIIQNSLVPVFVDVDLGTYNISIEALENAISPNTKAIMIAHTMGNPFNLDKVMEVANKHNLWVVEDNCDALGSLYNGRLTGTYGHIGTSSFYPPHHITMGEGGAVYTNNPLLKTIIESFRDWGRDCWCPSGCDNTCHKRFGWQLGDLPYGYDHKYTYSHLGYNLKVTDMQAAIGLEQLKKLPTFIDKRINNFNLLKEELIGIEEFLILPEATPNSIPSWFGFILSVRDGIGIDRNKLVRYLEENRIQTRMLFAGNIIKQPAFKDVKYRLASPLINTEKIMNDTFLVGVYPGLSEKDIRYMGSKIIEAVEIQLQPNDK